MMNNFKKEMGAWESIRIVQNICTIFEMIEIQENQKIPKSFGEFRGTLSKSLYLKKIQKKEIEIAQNKKTNSTNHKRIQLAFSFDQPKTISTSPIC